MLDIMKYDRKFSIRRNTEWNNIEKFYKRVAKFMTKEYGCIEEEAVASVQNALSFDYAVCTGKKNSVFLQTNVYHNAVYVGCTV